MPKKVLILGGSTFQVPLIEYAKSQGDHVITADYLPGNPGHKFSDEYHNVSTTDVDSVVALAESLNVDAVMTFASDPALPAVSAVGEALGIPAPGVEAVRRLGDKGQFRRLLDELKLPVPRNFIGESLDLRNIGRLMESSGLNWPLIVKPVDSCGSKGISVLLGSEVGLHNAVEHALEHSRAGRFIVEEYIDSKQVHGDGFLVQGKLVHLMLGDHYFFTGTGSRIPQSTRWPGSASNEFVEAVAEQVERVTRFVGYTDGPLNIEARAMPDGRPFLVECAPRNGGNNVPLIQARLSGFDLVGSYYRLACGMNLEREPNQKMTETGACFVFHPSKAGIFSGITLSNAIEKHLFRFHYLTSKGVAVSPSRGSGQTVAVALFVFEDRAERDFLMDDIDSHMVIVIEEVA